MVCLYLYPVSAKRVNPVQWMVAISEFDLLQIAFVSWHLAYCHWWNGVSSSLWHSGDLDPGQRTLLGSIAHTSISRGEIALSWSILVQINRSSVSLVVATYSGTGATISGPLRQSAGRIHVADLDWPRLAIDWPVARGTHSHTSRAAKNRQRKCHQTDASDAATGHTADKESFRTKTTI